MDLVYPNTKKFGDNVTIVRNDESSYSTASFFEDKVEINTPKSSGEFNISFYIEANVNNVASACELRVYDPTADEEIALVKKNLPADDDFVEFSGAIPVSLIGDGRVLKLQFRRVGDLATVETRRARLQLWRLK